ncbi:MAG: MFS transporter, partial [Eggerthellaceae bacterium]
MNSAASSFESPSKITGQAIRIVAVVVLGAFLALLNQTVMSPALPMIMKDFNIDAGTGQWIMSVYPLVSGIMVPVSAYLINRFSTRKLFFASI